LTVQISLTRSFLIQRGWTRTHFESSRIRYECVAIDADLPDIYFKALRIHFEPQQWQDQSLPFQKRLGHTVVTTIN
jgi:hypothetical protein